ALFAVSKPMMMQTNSYTQTQAAAMFTSQVSSLPGLIFSSANLTVTITGNVGASNTRVAVVSYTAQSHNAFGGILGLSAVNIAGSSTATSSQEPNIDFYLLL